MKNIVLDKKDFEDLVSGKIVNKENIAIAFSDIGYFSMLEIINKKINNE